MAISHLHYSLSAAARERLQRAEREAEPFLQRDRTPNRKSEAKKRWWAERRARSRKNPATSACPMVRLVLSPLKRIRQIAHLLRHRVVRAAPTCTLWVLSEHAQMLRFRFCRRWVITKREAMQLRLGASHPDQRNL